MEQEKRIGVVFNEMLGSVAEQLNGLIKSVNDRVQDSVAVIKQESENLRVAHGDILMIQNGLTAFGSAFMNSADDLDETLFSIQEILDFVDEYDEEEEDEDWVKEEDEEVPCDCEDCNEDCDCECHNED